MQKNFSSSDYRKLVAIIGRFGSDHPDDRDAAVLAGRRLLESRGMRWEDVFPAATSETLKPPAPTPSPSPPPSRQRKRAPGIGELLATCRQHRAHLTDWERLFLGNIRQKRITKRQYAILCSITRRVCAAGAA